MGRPGPVSIRKKESLLESTKDPALVDKGLYLVNYTVALTPQIDASAGESRFRSYHSHFVWGYGEWRGTQEG